MNKSENINKEYLTTKQANYVYRKVQLGSLINKNIMRQELDKMDYTSGDENLYRLIVNNAGKIESTLYQVEQWSIFSNVTTYVQYDKNLKSFPIMPVKPVNKMKKIRLKAKGMRKAHIRSRFYKYLR